MTVIGLVFVAEDGSERRQQYVGTVDRFAGERDDEGVILPCDDGVGRALPWDAEALAEVEPGTYRLKDGASVVRDPDYIMQFVVHDDASE